jgi:hypothetical protein
MFSVLRKTIGPTGLSILVLAMCVGGVMVIWSIEPDPGSYDETARSYWLAHDIRLMWQTKWEPDAIVGPNQIGAHVSTDAALNAASRVFNTVDVEGISRADVIAQLGDPRKSNDSVYNFPFVPSAVPEGTLVYRFDSGSYGWQFVICFGDDGKVSDVRREWIH